MKTKRLWLILPMLAAMFGAQCKKESNLDPNGLPKATQTGRNIFACKVNGEDWISSDKSGDMGGERKMTHSIFLAQTQIIILIIFMQNLA